MPRFDISADQWELVEGSHALRRGAFDSFDAKTLGLGNIAAPAVPTDAIAAMFDLEGFTNFSRQIEPHLSVPLYLNAFLEWLMKRLRQNVAKEERKDVIILWAPLPFFVKFMGDGLLVLWDCAPMDAAAKRNILVHCNRTCRTYVSDFLPTIGDKISDPPPRLRCGVARGTVLSVGDGQDFVGSCINMAARLQKLPGISFCFNRRGFDIENSTVKFFKEQIVVRQVSIRGIGEHELVGLLRSESDRLIPRDRKLYKTVTSK